MNIEIHASTTRRAVGGSTGGCISLKRDEFAKAYLNPNLRSIVGEAELLKVQGASQNIHKDIEVDVYLFGLEDEMDVLKGIEAAYSADAIADLEAAE